LRTGDPDDFVRLEVEAALTRNIRVVPILVEGARMPRADELPPGIAKLAHRQALELCPNRFNSDLSRLLRVLDSTTSQGPPRSQVPPKLKLSTSAVDFGRIRAGAKPKPRRVTVLSGGNLNARIVLRRISTRSRWPAAGPGRNRIFPGRP
jgi:hypothetical protein